MSAGKKDSSEYEFRLSFKEKALCLAVWTAVSLFLGRLFFHSFVFSVPIVCLSPFVLKYFKRIRKEKRQEDISSQFCDAMSAFAAALSSGFSPENAVAEAVSELERINGRKGYMQDELELIAKKLSIGESIENAFIGLSRKTGIREIEQMADVFSTAKRSGGSLPDILRHTVYMLEEKRRLKEEIRTIITAKKTEHRIMCLMLPFILLYINLTGSEFVSVLYEGVRGRVIMTAALAVFFLAVCLGERIIRIRV